MNSLKNETCYVKAQITALEKENAKRIAKSKGMTFAGWLGVVVKDAMKKDEKEAQS